MSSIITSIIFINLLIAQFDIKPSNIITIRPYDINTAIITYPDGKQLYMDVTTYKELKK